MPLTRLKYLLNAMLFTLFASSVFPALAQREVISLNNNWSFHKGENRAAPDKSAITMINIPHTWNAFDVMDDEPGYYRGTAWYNKRLILNPSWNNKCVYLYFEGANQETAVYLNGKQVGAHLGGYTGFSVPLNNLRFDGKDHISVRVNNAYNEDIAPLTADFTFFGGIYRNVSLLVLDKTHFEDTNFGASGIYVHAENVNNKIAQVIIKGKLTNQDVKGKALRIVSLITDANGKQVGKTSSTLTASSSSLIDFNQPALTVSNPKLWSPENPYCYRIKTQLLDVKTDKVLDEVKTNIGLRYFSFNAKTGFSLNGKSYKLIGASRHQDYAGLGNAVPKSIQVKDVELLKEMGGNFLRVAHYPQDQAVLDACDRLGILASVEIPIVNEITESEAFYKNCRQMQLEMIKQNYNHPSIIIWAYMNEVLLRMKFNNDLVRKQQYISNIEKLAQNLEELTRKTDPSRYTLMSNHGDVNGYVKAGLIKIPMLVGWNLYQGWYGGKIEDFGPALDKIFQQIPDKPLLVTEFGADVDPRIHAFDPVRFDKSLEYGMNYHQTYIREMMKRPFVTGAAVWNLADFSSETREESMPHVNNKGLLTLDRQPKNTYYLYKANFSQKPYLQIGSGSWMLRGGVNDAGLSTSSQVLQILSNADSVVLHFNGKNYGRKPVAENLVSWEVPFRDGENEVSATAKVNGRQIRDEAIIKFQAQPRLLTGTAPSFSAMDVLMGSERQFLSADGRLWLPNQVYVPGSWGSIGGAVFKMKNTSRISYGTDKNIIGTYNDPIYQTQLEGLTGYQLDVPNGSYEIILHFAELVGEGAKALPYNLDSLAANRKEVPAQRVFDVYVNGKLVIKALNLAAQYGVAKAVEYKLTCNAVNNNGIKLTFHAINGKAVLNALQVKKIE